MGAAEIGKIVVTVGVVQWFCDFIAYWRIYSQAPYQRSLERLSRCQFKVSQLQIKEQQQAATAALANATSATTSSNAKKATSTSTSKHQDRNKKTIQRAQDDVADALANVAHRHTAPSILTSLLFLILMRILGTEYQGQIIAVLPFIPPNYRLVHRVTARGLQYHESIQDMMSPTTVAGATDATSSSPLDPETTDSSTTATTTIPSSALAAMQWLSDNNQKRNNDKSRGRNNNNDDDVRSIHQGVSFTIIYILTAVSVKYYIHQWFGIEPPKGAESIMALIESPSGQKLMRSVGIDPNDLKTE